VKPLEEFAADLVATVGRGLLEGATSSADDEAIGDDVVAQVHAMLYSRESDARRERKRMVELLRECSEDGIQNGELERELDAFLAKEDKP
jgi:hypothetical protein